jgi:hypothetical protein
MGLEFQLLTATVLMRFLERQLPCSVHPTAIGALDPAEQHFPEKPTYDPEEFRSAHHPPEIGCMASRASR